tara:strand:+ start:174 stop:1400 length:1227 start_codon:yes stop_codon:yes gene_type:complete
MSNWPLGIVSSANFSSGLNLWIWGSFDQGVTSAAGLYKAVGSEHGGGPQRSSSPILIGGNDPSANGADISWEDGGRPLDGVVNQMRIGTSNQTCLVISEGKLYSWGNSQDGIQGHGDIVKRSVVTQVGSDEDWESISVTKHHCLATRGGALYSWGKNTGGELGHGDVVFRSSPVQVGSATNWTKVNACQSHSAAINSDNELYVWGLNSNGKLGDGTVISRSSPVQIAGTDWFGVEIKVSATSFFQKTDGTLWVVGEQNAGEFGNGAAAEQTSSPIQVGSDTDWAAVTGSSEGNIIALKTNGTIWSWGKGATGGLGHGDVANRSVPTQIGSSTNWTDIATQDDAKASWGIAGGVLYAWGDQNHYGALGVGTQGASNDVSSPVVVVGGFTDWIAVYAGGDTTLGLRTGNS